MHTTTRLLEVTYVLSKSSFGAFLAVRQPLFVSIVPLLALGAGSVGTLTEPAAVALASPQEAEGEGGGRDDAQQGTVARGTVA